MRDDVNFLTAARLNIGLSSIVGITAPPATNCVLISQRSGGSFEIGGISLTWGQGFQYQGPISFNCSGTFYAAAQGGTAVIQVIFGQTGSQSI